MNNNPIGIFDSGVGGLSVWRAVRELLPWESILYFGDGVNCPYGGRAREDIVGLTLQGVGRLVDGGAKLVVVACNTATAAGIGEVRARFDLPVVGMLPAVKPAAATTQTGTIAVLATESSLHGGWLGDYVRKFAGGVEVITAVGEGFVELVEQGLESSPAAREAVGRVVEPLMARGADRIVLGCTHYPFLADVMREVVGVRAVEIVDPSEAVARRVAALLAEHGLGAENDNVPRYEFHTLAADGYLEKIKQKALKNSFGGKFQTSSEKTRG